MISTPTRFHPIYLVRGCAHLIYLVPKIAGGKDFVGQTAWSTHKPQLASSLSADRDVGTREPLAVRTHANSSTSPSLLVLRLGLTALSRLLD